MQAAFVPLENWKWLYAIASSVFWILLGLFYCQRVFVRFVTAVEGAA
jgi:hypothetical protein